MAGPVPTYLATQLAAQTAFNVPFGLLTLVNGAITTATANGEFNVTVDCSLFTAEDVSNLRIYLDSLGYAVQYAKGLNEKGLNIDWGAFLDIPGTSVTVFQGTIPWIIAGTVDQGVPGASPWLVSVTNAITVNQGTSPWVVTGTITTSPDVNIHDSAGNNLSSTGTALDVNVTNFPTTVAVTQSTSPWNIAGSVSVSNFPAVQAVSQSGVWTTGRTWTLASGTDSVTAVQGTSPWVVSGTVVTSPDVNIHTSAGGSLTATGMALDVAVSNFPATVAVTQGTSPWVIAGTVTANIGTTGGLLLDSTFTGRINTLGQKTMANSTPVVIASDQSAIQVTAGISTTGTTTSVARSNASQQLLAANVARKGATIYNDSGAVMYVKMGTTVSTTDFTTRIASQTYYEVPFNYTGRIDGIWGSNGAGDVRMTEFT